MPQARWMIRLTVLLKPSSGPVVMRCLQKFKIPVPAGCTSQLASKLIGTAITRRQKDLASFGQLKTLQKYGVNDINISFKHASTVIDAIAQNQWRPLPFANLDAIMGSGSGDDF